MSDSKKHPNRIPFEDIDSIKSWRLPSLGDEARVVPTAQREASKRQERRDVIIEEVSPSQVKPLTAEELQKISAEAEKEGREHGYQEGYARGLEEGRQKGLDAGEKKAYAERRAELEDQTARFAQLADSLMHPVETQNQALESLLVDMAIRIAQHLIEQTVTTHPEAIFRIVERAVDSLPVGAQNIQVHLHPEDVQLIQKHLAAEAVHWHLQPDSRLQRGGCRVASQRSLVDYSIGHRIQQYLEQVKEEGEEAVPDAPADYRPPAPQDSVTGLEVSRPTPVPGSGDVSTPSEEPAGREISE